jgi:hypothetical protein
MLKRRLVLLLALAVAVAGLLLAYLRVTDETARTPGEAPLALAAAELAALSATFAAPGDVSPRTPGDLATHPGQFTESWLFAGRLEDGAGRRFGFQLVFERLALVSEMPGRDSAWAVRDAWRALLIVEPAGGPARGAERLARGALGLAGAESGPVRAWVEDWSFNADPTGRVIELEASDAQFGLRLQLARPDAAPASIESASYRGHWQPDLAVSGRVQFDGRDLEVTGSALLERLWGRAQPVGSGQLALARLWLMHEGGAVRCEYLQRRAGGGRPLQECAAYPDSSAPEPRLAPATDPLRWPMRWNVGWADAPDELRLAPLSNAQATLLDASRRAVLVGNGDAQAWGLLVLSNFSSP